MVFRVLTFSLFTFLISSCSVFNSGSVNLKYNTFRTTVDGVTYANKRRVSDVSFSVRNVQHPKRHGRWGLNLKPSPSIHYERHTIGTLATARNEDGELEQLPDLDVRRLSLLGSLKLTLHTPIGAFAASAGYGRALSKLKSSQMNEYEHQEIRKFDFVWYKFISKRFFVLFGPRYYKSDYDQVTVALRLGFYWDKI